MDFLIKRIITRRSFVKTMCGAAAGCACFQLNCFASDDLISGNSSELSKRDKIPGNKEHLVAVCGLYCGACPVYIATQTKDEEKQKALLKQFSSRPIEDLLCDGCIGGGRLFPSCRTCAIRACPNDKQDVVRCSDCPDLPCSRITNLNNAGLVHLREVLQNLEQIQKMGITKWAKYEEERWQCPKCHLPVAWYDTKCSNCGAPRSERLFSLRQ